MVYVISGFCRGLRYFAFLRSVERYLLTDVPRQPIGPILVERYLLTDVPRQPIGPILDL